MTLLRAANAGATFFLELGALAALAALGSWGFRAGSGPIVATGLGVGAPLLAALLWGAFVAPKAAVPLPAPLPFILGARSWAWGPWPCSPGTQPLPWRSRRPSRSMRRSPPRPPTGTTGTTGTTSTTDRTTGLAWPQAATANDTPLTIDRRIEQ